MAPSRSRPRISEADIHAFHLSNSSPGPASAPLTLAQAQAEVGPVASSSSLTTSTPTRAPRGVSAKKQKKKHEKAGEGNGRISASPAAAIIKPGTTVPVDGTPATGPTKKRKARKMEDEHQESNVIAQTSTSSLNGNGHLIQTVQSPPAIFSEEQIILYHLTHPSAQLPTNTLYAETSSAANGASIKKARRGRLGKTKVKDEDRPLFSRPRAVLYPTLVNGNVEGDGAPSTVSATATPTPKAAKGKKAKANDTMGPKSADAGEAKKTAKRIDLSQASDDNRNKDTHPTIALVPPHAVRMGSTKGCSAAFWLGGLDTFEDQITDSGLPKGKGFDVVRRKGKGVFEVDGKGKKASAAKRTVKATKAANNAQDASTSEATATRKASRTNKAAVEVAGDITNPQTQQITQINMLPNQASASASSSSSSSSSSDPDSDSDTDSDSKSESESDSETDSGSDSDSDSSDDDDNHDQLSTPNAQPAAKPTQNVQVKSNGKAGETNETKLTTTTTTTKAKSKPKTTSTGTSNTTAQSRRVAALKAGADAPSSTAAGSTKEVNGNGNGQGGASAGGVLEGEIRTPIGGEKKKRKSGSSSESKKGSGSRPKWVTETPK